MAITVSAAWRAAVQRADARLRYLAIIEDGTTTWNALDASSDTLDDVTYPVGLAVPPSSVGAELDPYTREVTINQIVVPFKDGFLRPIMVGNRLRGQKLTLKIGAAELGAGDYSYYGSGVIHNLLGDGTGGVITVSCKDPFQILSDTEIVGAWADKHPLEILYYGDGTGVLERGGIPAALIDTAAFDPSNYTSTISHWNMLKLGMLGSHEFTLLEPTPALGVANHLALLLNGNFLIDNQGRFTFALYDATASVAATWTATDILSCKHVEQRNDIINDIGVGFWLPGAGAADSETGRLEWRDQDDDSMTDHAYLGGDPKKYARTVLTNWINATASIDCDNVATQAYLQGHSVYGFCGMREALKAGGQPAEAELSAARPAYLLIRGGTGTTIKDMEIVKVTLGAPVNADRSTGAITAFAVGGGVDVLVTTTEAHQIWAGETIVITGTVNYNGSYVVSAPDYAAKTFKIVHPFLGDDAAGTWRHSGDLPYYIRPGFHDPDDGGAWKDGLDVAGYCKKYKILTMARAQLDTIAKDWTGGALVHDITILVKLTDTIIKRYGYGIDVLEVVTRMREMDKEPSDLVALVDEHFVAFDTDGLDGSTKHEIIQKEPRPEDGEITYRVATAALAASARNYIVNPVGVLEMETSMQAIIAENVSRASVVSGVQSTTDALLVGDLSAGVINIGSDSQAYVPASSITYTASRDNYLVYSITTRSVGVIERDNGDTAPTAGDDEFFLWLVVTGAAAISSHKQLYNESRIAAGLIGTAQTVAKSMGRNHNFDGSQYSRGKHYPPDAWTVD